MNERWKVEWRWKERDGNGRDRELARANVQKMQR